MFDSDDQPLLILGPEQFPELRPTAPNLLRIDELQAKRVRSDVVEGNRVEGVQFVAPQDRVGKLVANQVAAATVVANNFVLTDGKNNLRIDGRLTVPIMRFIAGLAARYQSSQPAAAADVDADGQGVQPKGTPATESGDSPPSPPPEAVEQEIRPATEEKGAASTDSAEAAPLAGSESQEE